MLCAATADGTSTLTNAACEPHVQEFCAFLAKMGAKIEGIGTSRLVVEGVERLSGAEHDFTEDFHEIATFLALGAITGGEVQRAQRPPRPVPADRPHLRQVRRAGDAQGRLVVAPAPTGR